MEKFLLGVEATGVAISLSSEFAVPSSFCFPLDLSSVFFLPNPKSLRFPDFEPSVPPPTASASLFSADLDTDFPVVSWNPSPSRGTLEVEVDGCGLASTGVFAFGCRVLVSEALILKNLGLGLRGELY